MKNSYINEITNKILEGEDPVELLKGVYIQFSFDQLKPQINKVANFVVQNCFIDCVNNFKSQFIDYANKEGSLSNEISNMEELFNSFINNPENMLKDFDFGNYVLVYNSPNSTSVVYKSSLEKYISQLSNISDGRKKDVIIILREFYYFINSSYSVYSNFHQNLTQALYESILSIVGRYLKLKGISGIPKEIDFANIERANKLDSGFYSVSKYDDNIYVGFMFVF